MTGVVPALLGRRARSTWLPAPVAGARATVLLVLDGLGWDALRPHPRPPARARGRAPAARSPPWCRRPPPAALTSITTGLPPARHGITGFRIRVEQRRAQRHPLAAGRRRTAARSRARADGTPVFCGRPVPVVTKAEFRTTGFTGAHLRGADFHGWQTTSVLVEHVRALVAGGAPFVYAYYPGVDEVAHEFGLDDGVLPGRARGRRPARRRACSTRCPADAALVVTADHGRCTSGRTAGSRSARSTAWSTTYAGDGRFRYLHARRAPPPSSHAAARGSSADATRGCSARASCSTRAGSAPTRCPRPAGASATSCSRPATPVGFVDPTLPDEAGLRSAHGSHHRRRDARSRCSPAAAGWTAQRSIAVSSRTHTGVIRPQACGQACGRGLGRSGRARWPSRSSTSTCTPSTRCSTVRRASHDVVATAAADGQPAVGITDHGNMYGVLDFYRAAREADLTPVIGTEAYMVTTSRLRPPAARRARHLPPHAARRVHRRATGTSSRCRRRAYLDGFFQKPRVDFELLEQHHEGLVATTGCLGGAVSQALLAGRLHAAREQHVERFQSIFGRDSFFVELQDHGLPEQLQVNPQLIQLARDIARAAARHQRQPLHAPSRRRGARRAAVRADRRHARRPEALQVRRRRVLPEDGGGDARALRRLRGGVRQHAARSPSAPTSRSSSATRCCRRSRRPQGHDEDSYLRELTHRGREGALRRCRPAPRCSSASSTSSASSRRWGSPRTSSSCGTSCGTRASRGIRVGPGRGSAAGSCVAYCLRIVDIDPIRYDLLFERFLNPGRKQMPDIDMDFDSRYRGEMIKYAAERYGVGPRRADRHLLHHQGAGRGARLGAGARLPVRRRRQDRQAHAAAHHGPRHAAARVPREAPEATRTATRWPPSCATLYDADPDAKRVIDVARGLEGPAPPGRHPRRRGGDHPRAAHRVPADPAQAGGGRRRSRTRRSSRSTRCTGSRTSGSSRWTSSACATSTSSRSRSTSSSARTGVRPDIDHVAARRRQDLRAAAQRGDTIGVFQLEGGPMRALLRSLAPDRRSRTSPRSSRCTARARWPQNCTTTTPTARTAASRSPTPTPTSRRCSRPPTG